jgi:hypothetical protein
MVFNRSVLQKFEKKCRSSSKQANDMIVHVVSFEQGEYSDHSDVVNSVFSTREAAEEAIARWTKAHPLQIAESYNINRFELDQYTNTNTELALHVKCMVCDEYKKHQERMLIERAKYEKLRQEQAQVRKVYKNEQAALRLAGTQQIQQMMRMIEGDVSLDRLHQAAKSYMDSIELGNSLMIQLRSRDDLIYRIKLVQQHPFLKPEVVDVLDQIELFLSTRSSVNE